MTLWNVVLRVVSSSPKLDPISRPWNLAMALTMEAVKLLEQFQWIGEAYQINQSG